MQKKLIVAALAGLAAAPAFAQSNVTVYGVFDIGYTSTEAKNKFTNKAGTNSAEPAVNAVAAGTTTKVKNSGLDGALSGGRLGFKGSEDLGNGLKANFALEFGTNWSEGSAAVQTGDAATNKTLTTQGGGLVSTRLGWAGVSGGFGEVRVGRIQSPTKMLLDAHNPNENSTTFAPGNLDTLLGLTDVRVSNAWTYITPTVSGFNAVVQYANVESDAADAAEKAQDKYLNFGLNYNNGPLAVAYARNKQNLSVAGFNDGTAVEGADAQTVSQVLAVKYNFGVAIPFYSRTERDAETSAGVKVIDSSVDTIGVTVPVGNLKLVAQYADGKSKAISTGSKIDHKAYQLLGVYNLSKRTNVYGIYGSTESKNATTKYELDGFALGLRHTF